MTENARSAWALCPVSCFINSRLIFHTCAVLGDIGSYTRQTRVHRFHDSFPKRKGRKTRRRNREEMDEKWKFVSGGYANPTSRLCSSSHCKVKQQQVGVLNRLKYMKIFPDNYIVVDRHIWSVDCIHYNYFMMINKN